MPQASESVTRQVNNLTDDRARQALQALMTAQQADLAALRAAIVAITAKLDADGGVTDTNYAATCNPAALYTLV